MNILAFLALAASTASDRVALGSTAGGTTYGQLWARADVGATALADAGATRVIFVAGNGEHLPLSLFAAAAAGVPFVPLNYRLGEASLSALLAAQPAGTVLIHDERFTQTVSAHRGARFTLEEWNAQTAEAHAVNHATIDESGDEVAIMLYTSGTSAAPKAAMLRHRHLSSYIVGSVEFASAATEDAALVTVPPYHIAGIAAILSNIHAQRRIVYLDQFTPAEWLGAIAAEGITNAMVVPTMLARVVAHLDASPDAVAPPIRSLAYGGARMPLPVLERALELFPETSFVNAYGLTETSSTIAVLGPDDHRAAIASADPAARARLTSVGRPVPELEVSIRDGSGNAVPPRAAGELWVRGPQVSGEYAGIGDTTDKDGWFPTKDLARLDEAGYLFIEGRLDDTIIRGGENIAPAEIEDVILRHPDIAECTVVGVPDDEWGQRIAAVVVALPGVTVDVPSLRSWVAQRMRSSKTPDDIRVWDGLPQTDTGKILRRRVLEDLLTPSAEGTENILSR